MSVPALRFTAADADAAADEWGMNCGPGAIAAICGLSLAELRPHLGDFERKRYTNPTLMWAILNSVGARWRLVKPPDTWPDYGLVRVQWEGPWMADGVPIAARYRHTHWIGASARNRSNIGVFDINCMNGADGWVSLADWQLEIVPWILREAEPKATGGWHFTHVIECAWGGLETEMRVPVCGEAERP